MSIQPKYEELEQRIKFLENNVLLLNKQFSDSDHDKELFRLAFENANIGMCLVNLNGNLFKVNAEMANIFGYTTQELEGMNVNDIAHPDFKDVSPRFIKNASEGSESHVIFEKQYVHRNGTLVTCIVTSSAVCDANNKPMYFISHVQDITERKNAERKLYEQNIELQKANAEKDKFFSIIAHDLRSPFNTIVGMSDILIEQIKAKDYIGIEKYADLIKKSSYKAMGLLKNLIEWTKSQTGRMKFNPSAFDMVETIVQVEYLLSEIAHQKSITIDKILPPTIPVLADQSMISTILRNLISNSIKFTNHGGNIRISASSDTNGITVSVIDNGVGIPKERIETLFQLDESYSTQGTEKETGSGLGLILCKEFIDKHNGKIGVESVVDKGSTFYIYLPHKP